MNNISTTSQALAKNPTSRPANFTRHTTDLVAKFKQNHQWHLIPLYHLLRLSEFGREGIERSGSYKFADHLYRNEPAGQGIMGKWLDRVLLNLPAARGMRQRCVEAERTLEERLDATPNQLRVLALPCGIPRDVTRLLHRRPELTVRLNYVGMDMDEEVLGAAAEHLQEIRKLHPCLIQGDALVSETYPEGTFDLIISTGLGEFLHDEALRVFYKNVFDHLNPGGMFYTSATTKDEKSDFLLRSFELNTNYRDLAKTRLMLAPMAWSAVHLNADRTGLQTFVRAIK